MAYSDFTLPALSQQFSLTIDETTDLFADVPETTLRLEFQARLDIMVPFALATSTEKARSEFIIAPVLLELWLLHNREIGLLSGVEFRVCRKNVLGAASRAPCNAPLQCPQGHFVLRGGGFNRPILVFLTHSDVKAQTP